MSFSIKITERFAKDIKALTKHYRSMCHDYGQFLRSLQDNPMQGIDLGEGFRKVRMTITAKRKGKSGGARVITYTALLKGNKDGELLLLTIYNKSERSTITKKEILQLAKESGIT